MGQFRIIPQFVRGFFLPLKSLGLILRHPKLLAWAMIPLAITLALSAIGLTAFRGLMIGQAVKFLSAHGLTTEGFWFAAVRFLFDLILVVFGALTFSIIAGIVASPFSDFLAEAAEPYAGTEGRGLPALSPNQLTWRFRLRSIALDALKMLFVGALQTGLLVASLFLIWIPGLNVLLVALSFLLLSYQFLTYPQTRRGIGIPASFGFVFRHFPSTFGLGVSLGLLFSIPLVSAFILPLAVVSGTLLYGLGVREEDVG